MMKNKIEDLCLVCKHKTFSTLYDNLLKKCSHCEFITYNQTSDHSYLIEEIYNSDYFHGSEYLDYISDKDIIQKNFDEKLKIIDSIIYKNPSPEFKNILEIGCAYGLFGELINKKYPNTKYTGIDVVDEAIDYARLKLNLNTVNTDYLDLEKPNTLYSDIFLWDVIEHLQYPQKILEKAYSELDDNGRIYISTGDISSFLPRIQGKNWRMIHPPSHLHYFSKKTLSLLLSNNGFKVIKTYYPAVSRSLKQIFYSLFLLNKKHPNKIIKNIYNIIPDKLYIKINTFDIMNIVAVKLNK